MICGSNGLKISTRPCGLAEVCSIEQASAPPLPSHCPGMSTPTLPLWKMTKTQLQEACNMKGIPLNRNWTVLELRSILSNAQAVRDDAPKTKGLASMTLAELRDEAMKSGIEPAPKESKGSLMLRIRDARAPDETVMTIGRFKGSSYPQIPEKYGDWASEEERQNGDNMHPDLKRYVTWRRLKRTMDAKATTENMYLKYGNDPEANAKVPPPPVSETGYGSAWSVVEPGQGSDQRPLLHRPSARASTPRVPAESGTTSRNRRRWTRT